MDPPVQAVGRLRIHGVSVQNEAPEGRLDVGARAAEPVVKVEVPEGGVEIVAPSEAQDPLPDPHIRDLYKLGMNHICFAVDDIEAEVAKLRAHGFETRNEIMDFHSRRLVFIEGPEGVTIELAQWV